MHLFISGTDTGIGKTIVASLLAARLNKKYWKPIQSGLQEASDTERAAEFLGKDRVLPEVYRLSEPLSPHLAARIDGVEIRAEAILERLRAVEDPLIVEGAGGLLVPINQNQLIIDLMRAMACPCVLVARSTLGTINHTLLSLEAMRSRKIPIAGVILNGPPNPENRRAIECYGDVPVIGELPWLEQITPRIFDALVPTILNERGIDL